MTRKRGWMPLREERLRPAERSSRRGARMKTADRIDATAIVCSVDVALLRRIASTLLEGEINTARRAKPLPPALEAPIRAGRPARRRPPHAHRRIVWRAGALSEEGGSAAGAP